MGVFGQSPDTAVNLADLESVHRFSTMSSLRRDARSRLDKEREEGSTLAKDSNLTEGERLFQESLANSKGR